MAKIVFEGTCVLSPKSQNMQFTLTAMVRKRKISTYTLTGDDEVGMWNSMGKWMAKMLFAQMDLQHGYHFVDDEHPFQTPLEF
jgi:hypothetical protein